ncbi:hypothetical protein ACFLZQ_08165, partial [Thermodesulfobacteriota bacterium]
RGQWIGLFYLTLSDISAAIDSFSCRQFSAFIPDKTGAMDKSFLLDTVRHICRYVDLMNKKAGFSQKKVVVRIRL